MIIEKFGMGAINLPMGLGVIDSSVLDVVLICIVVFLLCSVMLYIISVFGTAPQTFEEALQRQRASGFDLAPSLDPATRKKEKERLKKERKKEKKAEETATVTPKPEKTKVKKKESKVQQPTVPVTTDDSPDEAETEAEPVKERTVEEIESEFEVVEAEEVAEAKAEADEQEPIEEPEEEIVNEEVVPVAAPAPVQVSAPEPVPVPVPVLAPEPVPAPVEEAPIVDVAAPVESNESGLDVQKKKKKRPRPRKDGAEFVQGAVMEEKPAAPTVTQAPPPVEPEVVVASVIEAPVKAEPAAPERKKTPPAKPVEPKSAPIVETIVPQAPAPVASQPQPAQGKKNGKKGQQQSEAPKAAPVDAKSIASAIKLTNLKEEEIQSLLDILVQQQASVSQWRPASGGMDTASLLKKQLEEKDNEVKETMALNKNLKGKLEAMRLEHTREKSRLVLMESQVQERFDRQAQELRSLRLQVQQEHENHMSEKAAMQQKVAALETTSQQAADQAAHLKATQETCQQLQQTRQKMQQEVQMLQGELSKSVQKVQMSEANTAKAVEVCRRELEVRHRDECAMLGNKLEELNRALVQKDGALQELNMKLAETEEARVIAEAKLNEALSCMPPTSERPACDGEENPPAPAVKEIVHPVAAPALTPSTTAPEDEEDAFDFFSPVPLGSAAREDEKAAEAEVYCATSIFSEYEVKLKEKDSEIANLAAEVAELKAASAAAIAATEEEEEFDAFDLYEAVPIGSAAREAEKAAEEVAQPPSRLESDASQVVADLEEIVKSKDAEISSLQNELSVLKLEVVSMREDLLQMTNMQASVPPSEAPEVEILSPKTDSVSPVPSEKKSNSDSDEDYILIEKEEGLAAEEAATAPDTTAITHEAPQPQIPTTTPEVEELTLQVSSLNTIISQKDSELNALKVELKDVMVELVDVKESLEQKSCELELRKSELTVKKQELDDKKAELYSAKQEHLLQKDHISSLQSTLDAQSLNQEASVEDCSKEELEKEIGHYKQLLKETESMLERLQAGVEDEEEKWKQLVAVKDQELVALKLTLSKTEMDRETDIDRLNARLSELEANQNSSQIDQINKAIRVDSECSSPPPELIEYEATDQGLTEHGAGTST